MSDEAKTFSLARLLSADLGIDLGTENAARDQPKTGEVFSPCGSSREHRRSGEVWGVGRPGGRPDRAMPEAIEECARCATGADRRLRRRGDPAARVDQHARNRFAAAAAPAGRALGSLRADPGRAARADLGRAPAPAPARSTCWLAPMAAALGAGVPAPRGRKLVIDNRRGTTGRRRRDLSGVRARAHHAHGRHAARRGGARLAEAQARTSRSGLRRPARWKEQLGFRARRASDLRDVCNRRARPR